MIITFKYDIREKLTKKKENNRTGVKNIGQNIFVTDRFQPKCRSRVIFLEDKSIACKTNN